MASSGVAPVVVPPKLGSYTFERELGRGATATVYMAVNCWSKVKMAIKVVPKNLDIKNLVNSGTVKREIAVMKLLNHPNILSLCKVEEDENNLYMVMELAPDGNMSTIAENHPELEQARELFRQVATAVAYMHSKRVCHHDIKLENVLLILKDDTYTTKLADFGMAVVMREGTLLEEYCGSIPYMSPEMMQRKPFDGVKSDVWSLGVLLYTLLKGELPFDSTQEEYVEQLKDLDHSTLLDDPAIDPDARDLLHNMLALDPESRYTSEQVLKHKWVGATLELEPLPFTTGCLGSRADIDEFVFASLVDLGFCSAGSEDALRTELVESKSSQARAYYYMLQEWSVKHEGHMTRARANTATGGRMPPPLAALARYAQENVSVASLISRNRSDEQVVVGGVVDRVGSADSDTVLNRLKVFLDQHTVKCNKMSYGYLCLSKNKKCKVVVLVESHHRRPTAVRIALASGSVEAFHEFCRKYPKEGLFPDCHGAREPS